jgi:hypothetical protein
MYVFGWFLEKAAPAEPATTDEGCVQAMCLQACLRVVAALLLRAHIMACWRQAASVIYEQ